MRIILLLSAASAAYCFSAANISEPFGDKGCWNTNKPGSICANALSPTENWALHFKDMLQQKRYKIIGVEHDWETVPIHNRSPSHEDYEQKSTVGYSATESTEISKTWSASLSFSLGLIGGSASFSETYKRYGSQSFSVSEEHSFTVHVPPHSTVFFHQRKFHLRLELESAPQIKVDGNKGPEQVYVDHNPPRVHFKNPYGGSDCDCDAGDLIHPTISFKVQCYSTNQQQKGVDSDCPFK